MGGYQVGADSQRSLRLLRLGSAHRLRSFLAEVTSVDSLNRTRQTRLMVFGIILALGAVSAVLAQKLKIPDVVVFLVLGTLLGPGAVGIIDVKADSALNQLVLIFGSCYILFDGARYSATGEADQTQ
jgi:hypothetical protein